MKDNLILVLLSVVTAVAGTEALNEFTPRAAGFIQEGRFAPAEPEISQSPQVKEFVPPVNWTASGPVSNVVDPEGTGPPIQDDYPRTPNEIRQIVRQNKQFGWVPPDQTP